MNNDSDPAEPRRTQPPVIRYAALIGLLIVIGVVAVVIIGRRDENVRPTAAMASPSPGVSMGPTPRY